MLNGPPTTSALPLPPLVTTKSPPSPSLAMTKSTCNRRTQCHSRKNCPCKQAGVICSTACHPGRPCANDDHIKQHPAKQLTIADVTTKQEKEIRPWVTCFGISLRMRQKSILLSNRAWLDDELINAAQYMLREQHPPIGGFQSPLLGDCLAMTPPNSEFVQVLLVCNNHWLAVSTVGCQLSTVKVFDSLGRRLCKRSLKLVADLIQTRKKH